MTGIAEVDAIIAEQVAKLDVTSATAMTGRCYDVSRSLAAALRGIELRDDDGDVIAIDAWDVQIWDAPESLAAYEMAAGHYVTLLVVDGERIAIDLTSAQFGFTGPRIAREVGTAPTWGDF